MKFSLPARSIRMSAVLAAAALLFGALALKAPEAVHAAPTNCTVSDNTFDSEEQAFLTQINTYRAQNGLGQLTASTNLNRAASWLANDMATKNYMNHTDSLGRTFGARIQQCELQYSSAAENIAAGYTTASSVFTGWKNSSGHNVNMLGAAYKQIGIARVYSASSTYGWYWATDFSSVDDGTRATAGGSNPPATSTSQATATRTATKTSTPAGPAATSTKAPATPTQPAAGSAKAVMLTPVAGSRLASTTATFAWSPATNASEYFFYLGTTPGSNNLLGRSMGTSRSITLNGLPSNGSMLYVRLWTRVGTTWAYNDYTYRAK